jgi:ABC-2 type transport system permease protein
VVRRLAWLKWRLLWNGLRKDWQRRIGLPVSMALIALGAVSAGRAYLGTISGLSGATRIEFSHWAALALFAAWVSLPVVIFPLDENLDPDQFSLAPVRPRQLVTGLAVSALIAPSALIPLVTVGANVVAFGEVWPAALLGGALMVAMMVVAGQLFTTVISAILHTRRGRDLAMLIVVGIGLFGFLSQQAVRSSLSDLGLPASVLAHPLSAKAWFLPPVAVQRVVTEAVAGAWWGVLAWSAVAVAWILAMAWLWHRLLQWMLTTPKASPAQSRKRSRAGLATGRAWGVRTVMARKELRFYLRDPRQRLVWTGAVIFLGLGAASVLVGSGGLALFRDREWLPLLAPVLVLFVGLPIALNMFGWERNAASFLFVLPARPRMLMMGKNLAVAVALAVETSVMALVLAILSDSWAVLRLLPAFTLCSIACQLAVGNLTSVITPLRLPREGTDVFAQATEQGCLAIVAQLVSFFTIGLLLVFPASVAVLNVSFDVVPEWFTQAFPLVWGAGLYSLSLWLAGKLLARRIPEVVNWVQVV